MTKITDLDNLPGSLAGSAVIPGVQSGTTYGITADQIKDYVTTGGSTGTGGGTTAMAGGTAAPMITRDLVYGVPRKLSIISGGNKGYDNVNGKVMCCGHVSGAGLVYGTGGPGGDTNYDASKYLARGLAVLCTVVGGSITTVRVVNPGQMYRVGDELDITLQESVYSGGSTVAAGNDFSPCKIRIDEVEPFMGGSITDNHFALGSAAPHVLTAGEYGAEIYSGSTFSQKNPNASGVAPTYSSGEYFAMEMDWTSPLFQAHTQSGTTVGGIARATAVGSNLTRAGFNYAQIGASPVSSSAWGYNTTNQQRHTYDLAVPGCWAIVWQSKYSSSQFTNTGDMYKGAASASFQDQWQTVDYMLPEYIAGQTRINGAFVTGNGIGPNPIDLNSERSDLHAIITAALNIRTSDIDNDIKTIAETAQNIGGVDYHGIYNPSGSSTERDTNNTTTNFIGNAYQRMDIKDDHADYSHQHASTQNQTAHQYEQHSFYFVNLFDILGVSA